MQLARILILLAALVAHPLIGAPEASACDQCGLHGAVQLPSVFQATRVGGLAADTWTIALAEQFSTYKTRGDNDLKLADEDLELLSSLSVTQLSIGYNLTERVGLQLALPFVVRMYDHFENFRKKSGSENGVGDTSLLATYTPYADSDLRSRTFLLLFGGLKLPTGDTGSLRRQVAETENGDGIGTLTGRGLSLGSGSVDVPLGATGFYRFDRAFALVTTQYTIRTEGDFGYRFGNDIMWAFSPGWFFVTEESKTLSLAASFSGEHKANDYLDDNVIDRTSVNNVYAGPELIGTLGSNLLAQLAVDLPIASDVSSAVVEPEIRIRSSITFRF